MTSYLSIGQSIKADGEILIDPDFRGKIGLCNKPGGIWIKVLQHNLKGEDFICMEIKGQNDSMLYVSVAYSLASYIVKGWVKKSEHIGVYNRDDPKGAAFYILPTIKSAIATGL
ncbi:MAG: hypothetical protein ABIX01_18735 [Chitinophagaceae bacterium]